VRTVRALPITSRDKKWVLPPRRNPGFPGLLPTFKFPSKPSTLAHDANGRCKALEIFGPIPIGPLGRPKDASGTKGRDLYACPRRVEPSRPFTFLGCATTLAHLETLRPEQPL
jgi:hypothetical protein